MFKNQYYELDYDATKNQVNWMVKGFWPSVEVVPDMERDWNAILNQTRPGFTILANLLTMKASPPDVVQLHARVQQRIIARGLRKLATVTQSAILSLNLQTIGRTSGITQFSAEFNSIPMAQAWLDEKS